LRSSGSIREDCGSPERFGPAAISWRAVFVGNRIAQADDALPGYRVTAPAARRHVARRFTRDLKHAFERESNNFSQVTGSALLRTRGCPEKLK
jgi:hypothetical protein